MNYFNNKIMNYLRKRSSSVAVTPLSTQELRVKQEEAQRQEIERRNTENEAMYEELLRQRERANPGLHQAIQNSSAYHDAMMRAIEQYDEQSK
jgi:hypothetical protein